MFLVAVAKAVPDICSKKRNEQLNNLNVCLDGVKDKCFSLFHLYISELCVLPYVIAMIPILSSKE